MSPLILGLTVVFLALPALFLFLGWRAGWPASGVLVGVALFLGVLYAIVWFACRPSRFEVTPSALRLVWPVRARSIPRVSIRRVRSIDGQTFRWEVGLALRMGIGGLWGSFGWLWTLRGMYALWISRQDGFVLIERDGGRPLLLTPTDPERFVRLLTPPSQVRAPNAPEH